MATRLFPTAAAFGVTGLTGTAGYTVTGTAGNILAARTTAGITESPAGSGKYIAVAALDSGWAGYIDWDDGAGTVLSTQFTNTTPVTVIPAPAPTRRFEFTYTAGTPAVPTDAAAVVFSDPAGTYGARNLDTGAVLTDPTINQAFTHVGTGSYVYVVPEPAINVEYYVKVAAPPALGGGTQYYYFTSPIPTEGEHYADRVDLEREAGLSNLKVYASLESNLTDDEIADNIDDALGFADSFIDERLTSAGYTVPLVPLAGTTLTVTSALLKRIARKLAVWDLYRHRGVKDDDRVGDHWTEQYEWAVAELDRMIEQGITAEGTGDTELTMDAPIAVAATVDANGCDLPDCDPCAPYYSRWN